MKKILKTAITPGKHNNMFFMLIISIAMFFVYIGLAGNSQVVGVMESIEYTLPIWMAALVCILAVYSFVYYRYLCIYTLDEKLKDYGILASLGYNQKQISKAFLWCIAKSMLSALFYGLLAGTLIYFVILKVLNHVLNTSFQFFPLQGYIPVIVAYAAVYLINAVTLRHRINKLEISEMLNFKKKDKTIIHPGRYQNIGLILLVCSLLLLTIRGKSYNFASALFPMLFLTASAYCLTMSFSYWFTKFFVRSSPRYHRNLFYISQLRTNYKKYAKLLTACTIIVIFGLFMLIIDVQLTIDNGDHGFEMPYDFVLYTDTAHGDDIVGIGNFENQEKASLADTRFVQILDGAIQWEGQEFDRSVHVMPESSYFDLTGKHLDIKSGEIVVLSQIDRNYYDISTQAENGVEWGFQPPGSFSFLAGNRVYTKTIIKEIWEIVYNIEDQTQRTYIIADEDYETIVDEIGYNQMQYFVSVSDSENLSTVYSRLKEISPLVKAKAEDLETQELNRVVVAALILLAVMLLLFSLVSLIILRINQNKSEEKKKYNNLIFIGFSHDQLQGEIRKEMATLFFVPLVLGASISIAYSLLSVNGNDFTKVIGIFGTVVLFFLIEYVFYRVTVRKLSSQYLT